MDSAAIGWSSMKLDNKRAPYAAGAIATSVAFTHPSDTGTLPC
jgi:hypothetical protein